MVNKIAMTKDNSGRRRFLGKLALGTGAILSAPVMGVFAHNIKEDKKMKAIKKVRSLGFQWETLDPFLFCVHHEDNYPKGNGNFGPETSLLEGRQIGQDFILKDGWRMYHGKTVPGFPGHPHRGFETLTVVRKGMVDHADSAGGAGRYGNGDLQWMTAGKGLMHSEMFPLLDEVNENKLELFQIWLNLPKKDKLKTPSYKMFWSEDIPNFKHKEGVIVEVLAGKLFDQKSPTPPENSWANDPNNYVGVFNISIEAGQTITIPGIAEGVNRSIYFYEGDELEVAQEKIKSYHAIDVDSEADITIKATTNSKILILQGRPINEPVVQHGPFVMNSRQEIQEAFTDYQKDQFGGWPWEKYDQVHDKKYGRFARYTDGTEEVKST